MSKPNVRGDDGGEVQDQTLTPGSKGDPITPGSYGCMAKSGVTVEEAMNALLLDVVASHL